MTIKSVPELLNELKFIKKELELMKNDIEIVATATIHEDEKIIRNLQDFRITSPKIGSTELNNIAASIKNQNNNVVNELETLITQISQEVALLEHRLDQTNPELQSRDEQNIEHTFSELALNWEKFRPNLGKMDNSSLNFITSASKVEYVSDLIDVILKTINDIKDDEAQAIKNDFEQFIISSYKNILENDPTFLNDDNKYKARINDYQILFLNFANILKQIYSKKIEAIPVDELNNFIIQETYRKFGTMSSLNSVSQNEKLNLLLQGTNNAFKNKFNEYTGNNINDLVRWLHTPKGPKEVNPDIIRDISRLEYAGQPPTLPAYFRGQRDKFIKYLNSHHPSDKEALAIYIILDTFVKIYDNNIYDISELFGKGRFVKDTFFEHILNETKKQVNLENTDENQIKTAIMSIIQNIFNSNIKR